MAPQGYQSLNGCVVAILMDIHVKLLMLNQLVKFVAYQKLLKKIHIKPGLFCDVKMQIDARLNYPVTRKTIYRRKEERY